MKNRKHEERGAANGGSSRYGVAAARNWVGIRGRNDGAGCFEGSGTMGGVGDGSGCDGGANDCLGGDRDSNEYGHGGG